MTMLHENEGSKKDRFASGPPVLAGFFVIHAPA